MAGFLAVDTVGLNTNTNPALLPPGAMVQADNVIFSRPGIITPRPGFVDNANLTALGTVYQMFDYNGQLIFHSKSGGTYALTGPLGTYTGYWSTAEPVSETRALLKHTVARKNCYINLKAGLGKVVGTATAIQRAGQARASQGKCTALGSGSWLANNSYVAYKAVIYEKDANTVEVRGAPSGAVVYRNQSGGADGVRVRFPINQSTPPGTIEIYRTYSTAVADPSQEYFLASTIVVASTDIVNGYVQFDDRTADADLGQALYTNPSQEGVAQENVRPPLCGDLTLYNGMVFYADLTLPAQTTVSLLHTGTTEWGYDLSTGVGLTGDFTLGSLNILNVAPAATLAGLSVGQVITDAANPNVAGTYIQANTKITAIVGTTVTMNKTALATGVTKTFNVGEVITVNGTDYYGWSDETTATTPPRFNATGLKRDICQSFAHVFNTVTTATAAVVVSVQSTTSTTGTLRIEYDRDYTSNLTLKFTGAQHWSQNFSSTTTFAPYTSPGGVTISKVDQPEHVPATNYSVVGAELERVLRIMPTRDTLWIFKTDGLYRGTGDSPDNFRIDPFNYTFNLVGIETPALLDNKIYCFASMGFCTVSEDGVDMQIGSPVQNQYLDALPYFRATRQYIAQFYGVADQEKGLYICCVPGVAGTSQLTTTQTYCYSERGRAWSTWSGIKFYTAVQTITSNGSNSFNFLYVTLSASSVTLKRELIPAFEGYAVAYYDSSSTLNPISFNTTTNVFTVSSTAGVAAGDVVTVDPTGFGPIFYGLVTSVLSGTTLQMSIDPTDSSLWASVQFALGAVQTFRGYDCTLEYAPISGGDPNSVKMFTRGAFDLENSLRVGKFTVGTASDISTSYTTGTYTATYTHTGNPRPFGFLVSRNGARGTRLKLKIVINQPTVQWQYGGLRLEITPMTERVRVR